MRAIQITQKSRTQASKSHSRSEIQRMYWDKKAKTAKKKIFLKKTHLVREQLKTYEKHAFKKEKKINLSAQSSLMQTGPKQLLQTTSKTNLNGFTQIMKENNLNDLRAAKLTLTPSKPH